MDILEDVRVGGALPVGRVGQPSMELGFHLSRTEVGLDGVDGGRGGGEGDALGDDDGGHGYQFLSSFDVLIITHDGAFVNRFLKKFFRITNS